MDFDPACLDFLEHFDRPKTVEDEDAAGAIGNEDESAAIGFDPREEFSNERRDPPTDWDLIDAEPERPVYSHGIGWVLLWAGSLAVLAIVAAMLMRLGFIVASEHSLQVAARAAAMEATLPRATYSSVIATVERRLGDQPLLAEHLTLTMLQNGRPVIDSFRAQDGDEYSIVLSVPTSYVIPDWLERISFGQSQQAIRAEAFSRLPSRKLARRAH